MVTPIPSRLLRDPTKRSRSQIPRLPVFRSSAGGPPLSLTMTSKNPSLLKSPNAAPRAARGTRNAEPLRSETSSNLRLTFSHQQKMLQVGNVGQVDGNRVHHVPLSHEEILPAVIVIVADRHAHTVALPRTPACSVTSTKVPCPVFR